MGDFFDPIQGFRNRREHELFEHRFSVRAAEARKEVLRLIEQAEEKEELAKRICGEMEEFFKDSTRLAARIFGSIEEEKAYIIEQQVGLEMQEFFTDLTRKADELIQTLWERDQAKMELESALDNLLNSPLEPLEKAAANLTQSLEGEN